MICLNECLHIKLSPNDYNMLLDLYCISFMECLIDNNEVVLLMDYYKKYSYDKDVNTIMGDLSFMESDYDAMIKFYGFAIELGGVYAMNNLGYYYEKIKNDIQKAIDYYSMALDNGNDDSILNVVQCYINIKKYDIAVELLTNFAKNKKKYVKKSFNLQKKLLLSNNYVILKYEQNKNYICLICDSDNNVLFNLNCNTETPHIICKECFILWYTNNCYQCCFCKQYIYNKNITLIKK
jgi:TPR repeat protein